MSFMSVSPAPGPETYTKYFCKEWQCGSSLTSDTKLTGRRALELYLVQCPHFTNEKAEVQRTKTSHSRSCT